MTLCIGRCSKLHGKAIYAPFEDIFWSRFVSNAVRVEFNISMGENEIYVEMLPLNYECEWNNCEDLQHNCRCKYLQNMHMFETTLEHLPANYTDEQIEEATNFNGVERFCETLKTFGMLSSPTEWFDEQKDIGLLMFDNIIKELVNKKSRSMRRRVIQFNRDEYRKKIQPKYEWIKDTTLPYKRDNVIRLNKKLSFTLEALIEATTHAIDTFSEMLYDYEFPNGIGIK
jgi:hypothetical protein